MSKDKNRGLLPTGDRERVNKEQLVRDLTDFAEKAGFEHKALATAKFLLKRARKIKPNLVFDDNKFNEVTEQPIDDLTGLVDGLRDLAKAVGKSTSVGLGVQKHTIKVVEKYAQEQNETPEQIYPEIGKIYLGYGINVFDKKYHEQKEMRGEDLNKVRDILQRARDYVEDAQYKFPEIKGPETLSQIAYGVGSTYMLEKKYDQAEKYFKSAWEHSADNQNVLAQLMVCEGIRGDGKAIDAHIEGMQGEDEQIETLIDVANTLIYHHKRVNLGTYIIERAADLGQDHFKVQESMIRLNLDRANRYSDRSRREEFLSKAKHHSTLLHSEYGDQKKVNVLNSSIEIEEGHYDQAKELLQDFVGNTTAFNPEARYNLSKIYMHEGDLEQALTSSIRAFDEAKDQKNQSIMNRAFYQASLLNKALESGGEVFGRQKARAPGLTQEANFFDREAPQDWGLPFEYS